MSHALSAGADLVAARNMLYYKLSGNKAGRISPVLIPLNLLWFGVRFPPPLRLETISVRSGPGPVCENLRLSLPSPEKTWTGEGGGINSGGDIEAHTCLMRFLTNLARLCASKSANGPRSNSFRPDSPSTTNLHGGRKTQKNQSHHT